MKKQPRLIGYAFAAQELPEIPREPHDRPLDAMVTEIGIRHFAPEDTAA
jgi:5-formyltetrahydrofolate cyclo-ligase